MTSYIAINRICQFCETEFLAKTTVTKYCSDNCAKRAYKKRKRQEKIEASNKETQSIREKPIVQIKEKPYLTVKDAARLLNCSTKTVHRLIKSNRLQATKLSERKTIIKRDSLERLFNE